MEVLNERPDLKRLVMKLLRGGGSLWLWHSWFCRQSRWAALVAVPTVGGQAHAGTCSDGYTPIYGMTWVVISTPIGPVAVPRVIVVACA